jgi:hypothetical protein
MWRLSRRRSSVRWRDCSETYFGGGLDGGLALGIGAGLHDADELAQLGLC